MDLGIIGSGGFAREVLRLAKHLKSLNRLEHDDMLFVEMDNFHTSDFADGTSVAKFSQCDLSTMRFVIGIADPKTKQRIVKDLPSQTEFTSLISPLAFIAEDLVHQPGLVVMPFSYISCNVKLGKHAHVNTHSTIGHDTTIGDCFTCAHSVMIAGNNSISDFCYFGMNSATKQGIAIAENVSIGLNAGVVSDIKFPGTYVGTPCKLLEK